MIKLNILKPINVALPPMLISEEVTGRDENKRGKGTMTVEDVKITYSVQGTQGGWYQYSKRGLSAVDTIAPWDMTGNRIALRHTEELFSDLDSKGTLSQFDVAEIGKLSHLSKFPQFPFVSDKGFGVGLKNEFPSELIEAFKREFTKRAHAIKPSLKKISIVRRSNTGWPFLLPGTSRANEMNNLINVLLMRTELDSFQIQHELGKGVQVPPCSIMFTRASHGAHKPSRSWIKGAKGIYTSVSGSCGKYPRIRGVYANYGAANLAGRSLMSKTKDVLTSIQGLKHTLTSVTDAYISSAMSAGFKPVAEDISGFDLSVSSAMLNQVYDIYEAGFPDEAQYINFARSNFQQPVASPGFSKGTLNLYVRDGIVSSGDIMTSMNGCLINLLRMCYCLVKTGEVSSFDEVAKRIFGNDHPFLIWGDDTVSFLRSSMDPERWAEANKEIGFKTDMESEIMFLMKRYKRGDFPPHTPLSRLVIQTIGREHAYVGPCSAMIGLFHRAETALGAPGFDKVFKFLITEYFPNLRLRSYSDLKSEVMSTRFKIAAATELSTGPGEAWLKEFMRGLTRGSFDLDDFSGDTELLRYLGLDGGSPLEDFTFKPRGSMKSGPVLALLDRFRNKVLGDGYTAFDHLEFQKQAALLLNGKS